MGHLSLNQMFELTVNPLYALGDASDTAQRPQKQADDDDDDKYVAPFELDKLLKRIYETKVCSLNNSAPLFSGQRRQMLRTKRDERCGHFD